MTQQEEKDRAKKLSVEGSSTLTTDDRLSALMSGQRTILDRIDRVMTAVGNCCKCSHQEDGPTEADILREMISDLMDRLKGDKYD